MLAGNPTKNLHFPKRKMQGQLQNNRDTTLLYTLLAENASEGVQQHPAM